MKSVKSLIVVLAVLGTAFAGFVGCAKNGNPNGNVSGNITINGSSVNSSDTVNGQTLAVQVSNITMYGNGNNNGYYNNYYNSNQGTVNAMVTVNGMSQNTQIYLTSQVNYNNTSPMQTQIGGYPVYTTGRCLDGNCTTVALVMWFTTQTYNYNYNYGNNNVTGQYKMIGLVYNFSNNQIRAAVEQVGFLPGYTGGYTNGNNNTAQTLPDGNTMINTLAGMQ